MRIGLYSDAHISYTSSILPLYSDDSKYTTRLKMIIDTYKWMYETFNNEKVDLILNGGDTVDSNILRSEEITTISDAYSYSYGIPEVAILGNHEILDVSRKFSSVAIMNNFPFVKLYTDPAANIDLPKSDLRISVLPYMKHEQVTPELLKSLSADILLSHIDIKGSHLRPDYIADTGVEPELLAEYFGRVFNGHIHTQEVIETSKNFVMNIGNCTSISFGDTNTYHPGIMIFDTYTGDIRNFKNPYAILFRRFTVHSITELIKKTKDYNTGYRYVLRVTAPYDIADDVRDYLSKLPFVIASRVIGDVSKMKLRPAMFDTGKISGIDNIALEFKKYLRSGEVSLSHPIEDYIKFIDRL